MPTSAPSAPNAPAVLPLLPTPRSVKWAPEGVNEWVTSDPYGEVSVGVNRDLPVQEYSVSVSAAGAAITAGSEAALADGRNAFAQLILLARTRGVHATESEELRVPAVVLSDAPAYPWRGLMIDVARHFVELDDLRRLIDAMAVYRLNVLHLHLTDDQGWRFEVQGYPKLTEVGAWRDRTVEGVPQFDGDDTYAEDRHGGFYSQPDLKELSHFASERGVTIVPGVSVPGHVQAALAAYPQLGNFPHQGLAVRDTWGESEHVLGTGDAAFQFVRDVFEQLAETFEGPYVHIGGDEVPLKEWESSPEARTKRQEWGFTRESEILGKFTEAAAAAVAKHGKRAVAWDSAHLVRVPDNTVIMHRGSAASIVAVAKRGFQCVAAPSALSLDRVQGPEEPTGAEPALSLNDVHGAALLPKKLEDEQRSLVLGVHAQVATEYIPTATHLEYMLFPRLIAVAQHAWGTSELPFNEFEQALLAHERVLAHLGVESRKVGV